ncbi:hypothetical protein TNIN_126401 [Trichonephila inaurata madagascariensis]|uniref:Uncharacterized protein n=1 Tax=Trichonephila inaurata madagascariensis TaxID=2747483 RepID=A0A8X7CSD3_9ARAC|nr:hypothetical protein TNIN_126401 [Trichonephila inaurata madagascariensis]
MATTSCRGYAAVGGHHTFSVEARHCAVASRPKLLLCTRAAVRVLVHVEMWKRHPAAVVGDHPRLSVEALHYYPVASDAPER